MRRPRTDGSVLADRSVVAIVGIAFVLMLGNGIVLPVLPLFARSFGVGYGATGLLIAAYGIARIGFDLVRRARSSTASASGRRSRRPRAGRGVRAAHGSRAEPSRSPSSAGARSGASSALAQTASYAYLLRVVPGTDGPHDGHLLRELQRRPRGRWFHRRLPRRPLRARDPLYAAAGLARRPACLYLRYVPGGSHGAASAERAARRRSCARGRRTSADTPGIAAAAHGPARLPLDVLRRVRDAARLVRARRARHVAERHRRRVRDRARGRAGRPLPGGQRRRPARPQARARSGARRARHSLPRSSASPAAPVALGLLVAAPGRRLRDRRRGAERDALGPRPAGALGTAAGVFRLSGDVGFALGPLVAGLVASGVGLQEAFAVSAVPAVVALVLVVRTPETLGGARPSGARSVQRPAVEAVGSRFAPVEPPGLAVLDRPPRAPASADRGGLDREDLRLAAPGAAVEPCLVPEPAVAQPVGVPGELEPLAAGGLRTSRGPPAARRRQQRLRGRSSGQRSQRSTEPSSSRASGQVQASAGGIGGPSASRARTRGPAEARSPPRARAARAHGQVLDRDERHPLLTAGASTERSTRCPPARARRRHGGRGRSTRARSGCRPPLTVHGSIEARPWKPWREPATSQAVPAFGSATCQPPR